MTGEKYMIELVDKSDIYIGHKGKIPIPEGEKCCECGNKAVRRERNNKGIWSGRYFCMTHYHESYSKRPDVSIIYENSLKKLKKGADHRTGNLDPNCTSGKGYIGQKVTCKARNIEDLNIKNDNFNSPIDHSVDPELGILQSKFANFEIKYNRWHICTRNEIGKKYDYIILYCVENDRVARGYIIPEHEVTEHQSVSIQKNPNRGVQWYEKYRIKDIEHYDDAYQEILKDINEGRCPILKNSERIIGNKNIGGM